jgi:kinesin family protein 2/24
MNNNNYVDDGTPKIRVVIRKRPINKKETQKGEIDIVDIRGSQTTVVRETKQKVDLTKYIEEHNFVFDHAFDELVTNENLYNEAVKPLVDAAFNRAKVTCFAYGQTGSGKTYTMMGDSANQEGKENVNPVPGLYLLATRDLFYLLEMPQFRHLSVWISFYEIYCGKLHDLLNNRQVLFAREDAKQNVNIVGLQEKRLTNVQQLMEVIEYGNSVRVTGVTGANIDSSRSHAILQIVLKEPNGKLHGKMTFIDLAGSERGADVVDQNKQTRFDGAEINKSLLALKECIRALDQDKKHTPFRGSKLTLVLKDSFTGHCKTVMIGNISPCGASCEHTLNTLRYADRVKELRRPPNSELNNQLTNLDLLAQQLMLPRQNKNAVKIPIPNQPYTDMTAHQLAGKNGVGSQNYLDNYQFDQNGLFDNNGQQQQQHPQQFHLPQERNRAKTAQQPGQHNSRSQQPSTKVNYPNNPNLIKGNSHMNPSGGTPKSMNNLFNIPKPHEMEFNPNNLNLHSSPNVNGGGRRMGNGHSPIHMPRGGGGGDDYQHMSKDQILQWKASNEEDLHSMSQKHEQLIGVILSEEEEVIGLHRQHIDDMVELIKQEMMLLHEVDKPGSDVDEYVDSLDAILLHKIEIINILRGRLVSFREHLREEEILSKKFYEQRAEILDVFDLNDSDINRNEEMQLLDNLPDHN